ncbi:MAG: hypothetical protein ACKO24_19215 [Leptolyngbyaceae cyanobacterium]
MSLYLFCIYFCFFCWLITPSKSPVPTIQQVTLALPGTALEPFAPAVEVQLPDASLEMAYEQEPIATETTPV